MGSLTDLRAEMEVERFERLQHDDTPARVGRVDTGRLERALREKITGEVRFDDGSRALYATDASNYRQVPIGVVVPRDVDDVVHAVAAAPTLGAPVFRAAAERASPASAATSPCVMDFSKYMHRVWRSIRTTARRACEPGCVLDDLAPRGGAARSHISRRIPPRTTIAR